VHALKHISKTFQLTMLLEYSRCILDITPSNLIAVSIYISTVKPAHAVTSIKQSPVLKGHIFIVLS